MLAGLDKAGVMELIKEGKGFSEEGLVFELLDVEPLPDFSPPA